MTANHAADDLLARINDELEPVTAGHLAAEGVAGVVPTSDDERAMVESIFENLGAGVDTIVLADPETGQEVRRIERPTGPVIAYDPILGAVDAASYDQAAPVLIEQPATETDEGEAGETDEDDPEAVAERELRTAIIEAQLAAGEGGHASEADVQAAIERERERVRRLREAREQALHYANEVREYIGSYLVLPAKFREAYLDVLTVWAIHTHAFKVAGVSPYITVTAPTKGSGKTTVLKVLSTLVNNPSKIEVGPTAPVVRTMANAAHTLFLDEIDTLKNDQTFIGVMNSGYETGGSVTRVGSSKGETLTISSSTFCPKMIAGIAETGQLPLPAATLDRCIDIKIFRAKPGELTKRFRVDVMRDDPEVLAMREWMHHWTLAHHRDLRDAYVETPRLSSSRAEQIWEPLITIAGVLGGDWLDRLRAAAILLDMERESTPDNNTSLVTDVATVVGAYLEAAPTATQIKVNDLVSFMGILTGRKLDKKLLTADQVTKRLGAFGFSTEVVMLDGEEALVYTIAAEGELLPEWADLFDRYAE